jgi:hypothetical protein
MAAHPPSLLPQLPLALASWLFYRLARLLVDLVAPRLQASSRASASRWRVHSAELFARPGVFPILLVRGPRWNPHAILAMAGPFRVTRTLRVDLDPVRASAGAWSIVIYAYPGARTVAHLGSADAPPGAAAEFTLPPGDYAVSVRYYDWSAHPRLPAVFADGAPAIAAEDLDPDVNRVYATLLARRGLLSRCLHYHVYPLLRLAHRLPRGFVEREFLPVGNPETRFLYDVVEPGERLVVRVAPRLLAACGVYVCRYSRDSLPVDWARITAPTAALDPARERGYYVVRIHPQRPGAVVGPDDLEIRREA